MRRACIIGWPVAHSRSPLIHGHWLKQYRIAGSYGREAVRPEDFADFLRSLVDRGYVGANVTVPHKEAALRLADQVDNDAAAIGAANTLWLSDDGRLCATNTDGYGFVRNLDDRAPGWDLTGRPGAVLGAGGAARAILHGLLGRGFTDIRLANRTAARAQELAAAFGPAVRAVPWEARSAALEGCGLLVNTTTLGMAGAPPLTIDLAALAPGAVVSDIVYAPLETALLRQAAALGFTAADGLGMLLHQAVPGFATWFGVRPEVTAELRALAVADIG